MFRCISRPRDCLSQSTPDVLKFSSWVRYRTRSPQASINCSAGKNEWCNSTGSSRPISFPNLSSTARDSLFGPCLAVARGHSREGSPCSYAVLSVFCRFYFAAWIRNGIWPSTLRQNKLQHFFVREVRSHSSNWRKPGSGNRRTSPPCRCYCRNVIRFCT